MDLAYFIENTTGEYIDNTGVFKLINDLEIEEEFVYIDTEGSKDELEMLLDNIDNIFIESSTKRLVIRSVLDLADTAKELLEILLDLQERDIILCCISEPYLSGDNYYTMMRGFVEITNFYLEKRRKIGYQAAHEAGRVGRKPKTEEVEKAIRLYETKAFTTAEIEKMCNVSTSTLYRALKEIKNQK